MNQTQGIRANEKPVENDFSYVYAENKDKEFIKVTKAMMKVLLGVATNLSELANDKGFVDNTVSDLKNYYLKTETYSKEELDDKLSLVPRFSVQVVNSLPTENISDTTVYLVPSDEDEDNLYTEYIYVNGLWEILGTQKSNANIEIDSDLDQYSTNPVENRVVTREFQDVNDAIVYMYKVSDQVVGYGDVDTIIIDESLKDFTNVDDTYYKISDKVLTENDFEYGVKIQSSQTKFLISKEDIDFYDDGLVVVNIADSDNIDTWRIPVAFVIPYDNYNYEAGNVVFPHKGIWTLYLISDKNTSVTIPNSKAFKGFLVKGDFVYFSPQTLTEEAQAQARKNIGAASAKEVSELSETIDELKERGTGTVASSVEPMEDDIPKVFIDGVIPTTKDDVLAEMTYKSKTDEFHAYLKIKCQGSSSMGYDKKNFTIKMYSDEARETKLKKAFKDWKFEQNKYVLKANYIDHSHARNIVSARLWSEVVASRSDYELLPTELKTSPNNGAIDGFPIKVYTNGTYQGIYTWNIGKDDWLWNMNEDDINHVLLCGETNSERTKAETPCNFRALWSGTNEEHWSVEVGNNSIAVKNSINALITCVKDTDNETFMTTIGNHLDLQSAIDYYIHAYVICDLDGLGRNILLGTYDLQKWIMGAYDKDSTFGLFWNGNAFVPYSYACPEEYQEPYSLLFERIEKLYVPELKERYAELRKTVYSFSNMFTHFERFMDNIGKDLFEEDLIPYPNIPSSDTNNIKQLRDFIRDRLSYCDTEFANMDVHIPSTGITLDKTTIEFTDSTPITLVATVEPSNTTEKVVWYSSDSSIASVTDGVVTPVSKGSCVITASCGEVSASCDVNVTVSLTNILSDISWTDGYCIDYKGDVVQATGNKYSNMIDVSEYAGQTLQTNLWISADSRHITYDSNQEYIGSPNLTIPLSLGNNAKYMRLSVTNGDMDKVGNEFFLFKVENNLFTSDKVRDGGYTPDGVYDSTITTHCNISVEVTEGQQYMLHGLTSVFFFDDDGKVLDKITDTTISFKLLTVPENAKTMVAVAKDSYLSNKTPCVSTQYTIVGHTEVEF